MSKAKAIISILSNAIFVFILSFILVFSITHCLQNFINLDSSIALMIAIRTSKFFAILSIAIRAIRADKIKESKISFWISQKYPKLLFGYFMLLLLLASIENKVVWCTDELNNILSIEWTMFWISLTVFLVWNGIILESLKKHVPEGQEKQDFLSRYEMLIKQRLFSREIETSFMPMTFISINLFLMILSTTFVYIVHLPDEVITQNIVRCAFYFSSNTLVMLFLDILKPLKEEKTTLNKNNQVTKKEYDSAQAKAIIQMFISTEIKMINDSEELSEEEKRKRTIQFLEECKAAIPTSGKNNLDAQNDR